MDILKDNGIYTHARAPTHDTPTRHAWARAHTHEHHLFTMV